MSINSSRCANCWKNDQAIIGTRSQLPEPSGCEIVGNLNSLL